MHHHAARTRDKRLAFTTWEEGVRLFHTVSRAAPGALALCVMPDHVHVLCASDVRARLGVALGGYARWRNRRRGESGAVWEPLPEPTVVEGRRKTNINLRYIHLNACRAGLVEDPLAWPLATHIDAVGLVVGGVRARDADVHRLHAYVSGDPSVHVAGTDLPVQAIRACRALTRATRTEIARELGTTIRTVSRTSSTMDADVRLVERWAGDPRVTPLDDSVLAHLLATSRYRWHRR